MSAVLGEPPVETPCRCRDLAALVDALQEEVRQLRREVGTLRAEAGYWKSRHADAIRGNEQLRGELRQVRAEARKFQDKLFGRKTESRLAGKEIAQRVDEDLACPPRSRGGQPGHAGRGRRDYTHLPKVEQFRELPPELRVCSRCGNPREELADAKLRRPCRKVLQSLREHREGLVRFVDHPEIPMDDNASERAGRGPAVGRKNYYGSGALWSARLAATTFSIVATLKLWGLNPRVWMTWYFEQCTAVGGQAPADIQGFLPWNLSAKQRAALRIDTVDVSDLDTS